MHACAHINWIWEWGTLKENLILGLPPPSGIPVSSSKRDRCAWGHGHKACLGLKFSFAAMLNSSQSISLNDLTQGGRAGKKS